VPSHQDATCCRTPQFNRSQNAISTGSRAIDISLANCSYRTARQIPQYVPDSWFSLLENAIGKRTFQNWATTAERSFRQIAVQDDGLGKFVTAENCISQPTLPIAATHVATRNMV